MQQQKRPRSSTPGELSFPGTPQTAASPESKKGRGRPRKTDKDKKGSLSPTLPQNELEPAQPQQQQKKPEDDDDDEIEDDWMEDDDFERERVQSKKAKEDLGCVICHISLLYTEPTHIVFSSSISHLNNYRDTKSTEELH